MNNCKCCGKATKNPKYCSRSCSATISGKKYPKRKRKKRPNCLWCGKEVGKNANKYCSYKCQHISCHYLFLNRWKIGIESGGSGDKVSIHIRKYLHEKYNSKCQNCGWGLKHSITNTIPLEIHHKDGDTKNNKEENLELLCPNCHSLTENFGILNSKLYT